jgi:uncharacterized damage-inducible protein DinB
MDFLTHAIDEVGGQIDQVLNGLPSDHHDHRLTSKAMTPRETQLHLAEVYQAVITEAAGEKYEWGSFKVEDDSWENLWRLRHELRSQAKAALTQGADERLPRLALDYIVSHDAYHVGQMALLRMELDPNWDPYSIYQSS